MSDVPVFVRTRELACRSAWDQDLWKRGVLQLDEATVRVSDVIVWKSVPSNLAIDDYPDDLLDLFVALASDDEFDIRDWLAGE